MKKEVTDLSIQEDIMISIIIPVYNCNEYIEECIESIVKQTYKKWEIIIIDDGSTDGTNEHIKKWEAADERIRSYWQENQGSGPARNRGMKEAKGDYIAFMDGDDFWYDEFVLEKIVNSIQTVSCEVLGTFYVRYKDGGVIKDPLHREYFKDSNDRGRWICFKEEQDESGYSSYLYSRKFLIENNIQFPPYLRLQDPPFLVSVLLKAERYYVLPLEWYCYRVGHKTIQFTDPKINGLVNGCIDILEVAAKYDLKKLANRIIQRINSVGDVIIKSILNGNMYLLQLVISICQYEKISDEQIYIMQFVNSTIKLGCQEIVKNFTQKIGQFSGLIIYGAGTYGERLLEKIEKLNIHTEIVFAETQQPHREIVRGRKCFKIDELTEYKDTVLAIIAVKLETQEEMASNLKRLGFKNYIKLDYDVWTALKYFE